MEGKDRSWPRVSQLQRLEPGVPVVHWLPNGWRVQVESGYIGDDLVKGWWTVLTEAFDESGNVRFRSVWSIRPPRLVCLESWREKDLRFVRKEWLIS